MSPRLGHERARLERGADRLGRVSEGASSFAAALPFGLGLPSFQLPVGFAAASSDLALIGLVAAAAALALAGGLWGLSERQNAVQLRRSLRNAAAKARALVSARDAWLSAGRESLLVWSADMSEPLSFGKGADLMQACLSGPQALQLSAAMDALSASGELFVLTCTSPDGRKVNVRGRPTGGFLTVFLDDGAGPTQAADWRAALNAVPVPMWVRNKDLGLAFVNRALASAVDAAEPEILANNIAFDRSERDLAAAARANNEVVEARRFAVISGRRRSLDFTLTPLPDGSVAGTAVETIGSAEDEERLKQRNETKGDILEQLNTAVVVFGLDRRVSYFNPAFVKLWGLSDAWLATHPLHGEVLEKLRELRRLPEQSDFRAWKQHRTQLFEAREGFPEELWHLPTGQSFRVRPQPHPGGGVFVLFDDVSEQLRMEMSYNQLTKVQEATLDTLREGVAVFSPDGKLKLHNSAFARLWGLSATELVGEPHLRRLTEICSARSGGEQIWQAVIECVTADLPKRHRECGEFEQSDGSIISLTIAPLPDGATLASFADVTDRSLIESALRERNEALEASDNLKSEFVKRISYELRTPLNSIVGFAGMMKAGMAGPLNPRQTEYVEAMVAASNNLRDLVNDVLDLSQFDAGTMEVDLEQLDLYLLLFGVCEHAREAAAKFDLTLKLDCDVNGGIFFADAKRLKQALYNLLSNAFKFTPRGGFVTLAGTIAKDDVIIWVEDTGPGLPAEFMPSAFDRFSAKGTKTSRPGAGLGLTLVQRFIELHDGWVELESRPGNGTRVTCHLPRNLARAAAKTQRPNRRSTV